jgi:2-polyprenyl-3-methyl-5-hydroxy-6-metoxy-1,4-benzoquinol methylase
MNLRSTKRHWEKFARTDPLWAVLTDDDKKGNQWRVEEFFQTGVDSVAAEIKGLLVNCPDMKFGAALDFGCGVGRLSQALAGHYQRVVGVDISEKMLEHARSYNKHGAKVEYVLNTRDDLGQLASDQFDLVYSVITLQHMEPRYARRYIAEFVRVAAPGGVILFQVPAVSEKAVRKPRPFTLWPDTWVKRLYRDIRKKLATDPVMEMHALPREEVESILTTAGAKVIESYRYDAAGDRLHSWGYIARKP